MKAADKGDVTGMVSRPLYENGRGVTLLLRHRALLCTLKAADKGDATGMFKLACSNGPGVSRHGA